MRDGFFGGVLREMDRVEFCQRDGDWCCKWPGGEMLRVDAWRKWFDFMGGLGFCLVASRGSVTELLPR